MKILVAHYSRTGNNDLLAKILAKKLDADLEDIEDVSSRLGKFGIVKSAFEAILSRKGNIKDPKKDPSRYGIVILCTPAWVGSLPSPMRAYLSKNKLKFNSYAIASISGKGDNPKEISQIIGILGKEPAAIMQIRNDQSTTVAKNPMEIRLTDADLEKPFYMEPILDFVAKIERI